MHKYLLTFLIINCFFINNVLSQAQEICEKGTKEWNPKSAGPVTTWTAPFCGRGKFVVQPFLFYNRTRGIFDNESHYMTLSGGDKKYQFQEQFFAQFGITDRLEIDGQTVYQENYIKQSGLSAHADGFGDSYLYLRYCAIEEHGWVPHISGLLQLKIPTGKYQHADPDKLGADLMGAISGGGSWDIGPGIILTKKIEPFLLHADIICGFPQKATIDDIETKYDDYFNYDFGVEYFLPKGFNLMLEFNNFLQGDRNEEGIKISDSGVNYFTVSPGIGWSNDEIQTLLAYQRVITGKNTDANDSVVLTFVYTF